MANSSLHLPMRKYVVIFKMSIMTMFAYRMQMLWYTLLNILPPLFMIAIFNAVGDQVDQQEMTSYFILAALTNHFIFSYVHGEISRSIFDGRLSFSLVKPYPFLFAQTLDELAYKVVTSILALPLFAALFYALAQNGYHISFTPQKVLLLMIALLSGHSIANSISYIIGCAAFWFQKIDFLEEIKIGLSYFLGGIIVPLALFPDSVQTLVLYSPFRFLASFPIEIINQKDTVSSGSFAVMLFYALMLYPMAQLLYNRGLRRYESFGN